MPSQYDIRRLSVRTSESGSATAANMDRIAGFPDVRILREGPSVQLSWRFVGDTDPTDLGDTWTWGVERSGSPGGPFTVQVQGISKESRFFRDDDLYRQRENTRRAYYRVFIDPESGDRRTYGYRPEWDASAEGEELHGQPWEESGIRTAYAPGVIREIRQRIQVMVDHYAGTEALLYRGAWLEGRCPVCIDPLTGTQRGSYGGGTCSSCMGTSYVGGYYSPVRVRFVHAEAMPELQQVAHGSTDRVDAQRVIMPHWPIVEPDDLLRKRNGEVYIVSSVYYAKFYDYPSLCIATLSQAPRTHPISEVPLPKSFSEATSGPRRQHGRAMDMHSYAASLAEGSMNRAQFESLEEEPTRD